MKNIQEMLDILAEQNCKIEKTKYGAIIITPSVKREQEEPKFKDGDFVYYSEDDNGSLIEHVFIFKCIESKTIKQHLSVYKTDKQCSTVLRNVIFNDEGLNDSYRLATDEEKQIIFNALHKERKIWNPETRTIEEDKSPRVGDKCVFWDDEYSDIIISELYRLDFNCPKYNSNDSGAFEYCVRLQDFDFETMKPKI